MVDEIFIYFSLAKTSLPFQSTHGLFCERSQSNRAFF